MAQAPLDEQVMRETLSLAEQFDNLTEAAAAAGVNRSTFTSRLVRARARIAPVDTITAAPLPPDDIETGEIIDHMKRRHEVRAAHHAAKRWRRFHVPTDGPYGLMLFGDPHLDDDGCNWSLLTDHCELASRTPHLYGVSVGDVTNNWVGRLMKLYADQETSQTTARKLVKWFLTESGVNWFLWIHGNHDLWPGPVGLDFFSGICPSFVEMEDWQAKITLCSPNGHELRLWAAHNFKGNSIWNPLHGPLKAAQMQDWAHLYVAGHHHNWGLAQGEHPHRGFVYNIARVRGYKYDDSYAALHGFGEHQSGAAMVAVIDPTSDTLNSVKCFHDPVEGVEFLTWKRAQYGL